MAGLKERYTVQYLERGWLISIQAQGYTSAKKAFIREYKPQKGSWLIIWPQSNPGAKKKMRVT